MHAALVRLLEELAGILIGAVAGCDLIIVADVVARIIERGVKEGVEPDGIDAEALHIVKFADDSLQFADAVAVGVAERLRVDLVEHRVLGPFGHFGDIILSRDGLC